jgi:hypothetical protein
VISLICGKASYFDKVKLSLSESAPARFPLKSPDATATTPKQTAFWQAYRYLRRHRRWMDYEGHRRRGLPIGSGVTEAACKTVFTQRFKRSGMRWAQETGQIILDLRVAYLSGVWDDAFAADLTSRELPELLDGDLQAAKKASPRHSVGQPPRFAA